MRFLHSHKTLDPEHQETLSRSFFQGRAGKEVQHCIQCGTCSGSCPLAHEMDLGPRRILALLRDGFLAEVLGSRSIWMCVSCNACLTRCPQGVPVSDIMYALRVMSLEHNLARREFKMPDVYRGFVRQVEKRGRVSESRLAAGYGLLHPSDMPGRLSLALRLLRRRRI
ncbi:4Fe-4S dicluster domain-containing protein [Desulfonatronospira sp.]|uniref:4Fe-4S dicluster domain-containing protein n=1 Tax=Desulfonatronospira sp. TaxID=1962951 RepID=UPI0025C67C5C|nr:4Fe-4S dicluster domain-containing protein [Desulfonatronospira sp.]